MLKSFLITLLILIVAFPATAQDLAFDESKDSEQVFIANPQEFALSDVLDKASIIFDIKSLKKDISIKKVSFNIEQIDSASNSTILKVSEPNTGYILGAVSSKDEGIKEFANIEEVFKNYSQKEQFSLQLEIDNLQDDEIISFENPSLQVTYVIDDQTKPEISNISVKEVTDDSALVTWQTNERTSGRVKFGKTSNYTFTQNHESEESEDIGGIVIYKYSTLLLNLSQGITYHFKIFIEDTSGNVNESGNNTFLTDLNFARNVLGDSDESIPKVDNVEGKLLYEEGDYKFRITWSESQDTNVEGYYIYRQAENEELIKYAEVGSDSTVFDDEFIEEGFAYSYIVRSYRSILVSPKSDLLKITVLPDNIFHEDDEEPVFVDIIRIVAFTSAATLFVLTIGYFLSKYLFKIYNRTFNTEKRRNLFRDPEYIMDEFEKEEFGE
ncbi:MAG TPA: fibronectin type III domain-containing protein [Candidatus Dojkabacteria bacterium]|jgi:hypothetical protein